MRHSLARVAALLLLCYEFDVAAQTPTSSTTTIVEDHSSIMPDFLDVSKLPTELFPPCPAPIYTPVTENPDRMAQLFASPHRHFRLVIGVGEFKHSPELNRPFVTPTASLIDARLATAGYEPLPNVLATEGSPYLTGSHANKETIKHAVLEMANKLQEGDFGIIYYVGHGANSPSHLDLTLSVYDRPVSDDEGIRVSDVVGTLEVSHKISDVKEIPHYIIVLETCYSGAAVPDAEWVVQTERDYQTVRKPGTPEYPPNFVLISATAPGMDTRAFDLHGANLSAFGVFFLRALNEDWECTDDNQDGIITLNELISYIKKRLKVAFTLIPPLIDGPMLPRASSTEPTNFLAYSAARHVKDGARDDISQLWVKAQNNQSVTLTMPSGLSYLCTASQPCTVPISRSAVGAIKVSSQPISEPFPKTGFAKVWDVGITRWLPGQCKPCEEYLQGIATVPELMSKRKLNVAGATLQIN